jgi:hypothetical protein
LEEAARHRHQENKQSDDNDKQNTRIHGPAASGPIAWPKTVKSQTMRTVFSVPWIPTAVPNPKNCRHRCGRSRLSRCWITNHRSRPTTNA